MVAGAGAKYKRVLLKVSGEALMGPDEYGLNPATVDRIADEIRTVHALGVQVCLVIGGGNIFRGVSGAAIVGSGDRGAAPWSLRRRSSGSRG